MEFKNVLFNSGNDYVDHSSFGFSTELQQHFKHLFLEYMEKKDFQIIDEILKFDKYVQECDENFLITSISVHDLDLLSIMNRIKMEEFKRDYKDFFRNSLKELAEQYNDESLKLYLEIM